jgi:hypothetical protein
MSRKLPAIFSEFKTEKVKFGEVIKCAKYKHGVCYPPIEAIGKELLCNYSTDGVEFYRDLEPLICSETDQRYGIRINIEYMRYLKITTTENLINYSLRLFN